MKHLIVTAVAALTLATVFVGQAEARAPLGFQLMCLQNPEQCRAGGASQVSVTDDLVALLNQVNRQVNRSITPVNDRGADTWTLNARSGDCEDFALSKRVKLIAAGLPASALRIAYVKTRQGLDHAVLVVRSNQGDLALDNLTNEMRLLDQTGYRVISMSGANPRNWS